MTWLFVIDEMKSPIEINEAPKRIIPNIQPIIKLIVTLANSDTTNIYIKVIDMVIRYIKSAEKYLPSTIEKSVVGDENNNWSVCDLYSSLNSLMVKIGVKSKIIINIDWNRFEMFDVFWIITDEKKKKAEITMKMVKNI